MKVTVVIVSWNVADLLRRCLSSLRQHSTTMDLEVIVVDNNSLDDSITMMQTEFPEVVLLKNNVNKGFAAANNQGFLQASGDYILMLNPDTEVRPNAIEQLIHYLAQHPAVGIIGPALINPDGSRQHSVRRNPTVFDQTAVLLKLINVVPVIWPLRQYLCLDFDYTRPAEVQQLMGAALCFRRSLLTTIGPLDEDFFLWFEEVDFCCRTQKAGLKLFYYPLAEIVHLGKASFRQHFTLKLQKMFNRSLITYFLKHGTIFSVLWLQLMVPLNICLTWLYGLTQNRHR
ncbi:MAG: glycosyltransferase family 2 protein [Candidatus Komeilibacteria bacterium]